MTQDTRKDRRVKIVSLNVRYKSATVDEFIENHAHDVSRGGIYIKTGSPFPPGTLLKFEIRLVSDQALIMGVGRVVWKRDTTQGTGDRPAGMGVKFIKIDEPSKSVIDKLMNTRSDAGRAYESEAEATASPSDAVPSAVRAAPSRVGKSTMLGVGSLPQPGAGSSPSARPSGTPSAPPRPAATIAMFPKATPEADTEPKQEQTVMKQAAELLEEALREAGGSMEDVGTNPLFAGSSSMAKGKTSDGPAQALTSATSDAPAAPSSSAPDAIKARAMVAGLSPASVPQKVTSDPPRTTRESPLAKAPTTQRTRPASVRPSGRPSLSSVSSRPARKGGSGTVLLLGVVAAAAIAGVAFRDKLFGAGSPAEPPGTSSAAQASPQPLPIVSATPSADLAGSASAPAGSEAPADSASAAAAASASAPAPAASDSAAAIPRTPSLAPRPTFARPTPVPTAAAPAIGPKPLGPSSITATTGEPVAPGPAAPTVATGAPAAPAPAIKPKPTATATAKPSDDNPY